MAIEPVAVDNWAEALFRAAKKADQVDAVLGDAGVLLDLCKKHRNRHSENKYQHGDMENIR